MADSKFVNPAEDSEEDLVHCGICFAEMDKPKALPCLHTFCLKCLTSWSETSAKKQPDKYMNVISCPSCREENPLPQGGVKNLRSNFFVTKLKERKSIQRQLNVKDAKIPCTSCTEDTTPGIAVARCVECNDFLCDKCVGVHESVRILQKHKLLTLNELRTGKLVMPNLTEQETCRKHKGEVIRFYCETCEEPMCRDCSVIDHPRPDHKQVDLESTARARTETLLKLAEECDPIAKKIESAIEADERISRDLDAAFEVAMRSIKTATDKAVSSVVEALKVAGKAKEEELQQLKEKRSKEIECHRENLEHMRIRIHTGLELAHQVTEKGSDHDVATMYSSLKNTMKQACEFEPRPIRASLGKVTFTPNTDVVEKIVDQDVLGELQTYSQWLLMKTIGDGPFRTPRSVVFNDDSDVAITENKYSKHFIKIFEGEINRTIQTKHTGDTTGHSRPWGLAVSENESYYLTDMNAHVKVYDVQGNLKHRFETINAHGIGSSIKKSQLYGLSLDHAGRVYVGSNGHYVSIHNEEGLHMSTFPTTIVPYYLAVSSNGCIFVSDHTSCEVHVYDITGNHLVTFDKPEGFDSWNPTGICFGTSDEVYVASKLPPAVVFRYSTSGRYLGVLVKNLVQPWGIAINKDQDSLAVVDQATVKVFQLQ